MDSYIQDSQHLIQQLDNVPIPPDCILFSCDFESLYTNLDQEKTLRRISEFMADKLDNNFIDSKAFHTILSLILFNNYFTFNEFTFLQVIGIAMGQISGPDIANLAVYFDEILAIQTCKPFFYRRFIDDLYLIAKFYFDIIKFSQFFVGLKMTTSSGDSVNFLDLDISVDRFLNILNFKLYIKPTNTHSYLLPISNHPSFIFENIPKSIFIRIRRNCSKLEDFYFFSSLAIHHLLIRGYVFNEIRKIRHCIA